MTDKEDRQQMMAITIAERVSDDEAQVLRRWLEDLFEIRESDLGSIQKARAAILASINSKVVSSAVKALSRQLKTVGWDNRTKAQRIGLGAAAIGIGLFGSQGAGIAALGTAIGVPLWVVLGAGSMFSSYLYDELARKVDDKDQTDETFGPIIDVEPNRSSSKSDGWRRDGNSLD